MGAKTPSHRLPGYPIEVAETPTQNSVPARDCGHVKAHAGDDPALGDTGGWPHRDRLHWSRTGRGIRSCIFRCGWGTRPHARGRRVPAPSRCALSGPDAACALSSWRAAGGHPGSRASVYHLDFRRATDSKVCNGRVVGAACHRRCLDGPFAWRKRDVRGSRVRRAGKIRDRSAAQKRVRQRDPALLGEFSRRRSHPRVPARGRAESPSPSRVRAAARAQAPASVAGAAASSPQSRIQREPIRSGR